MTSRILHTPEIADRILSELRAGRSVHDICRDDGMPCRDTVLEWVRQDRDGFAARYRQARETGHGSPGPVGYTTQIADQFLEELMGGRTLVKVCGDPGMPCTTTINKWVATDREGFAARYRAARQVGQLSQAEVPYTAEIADQILDALMSGQPLHDICAEPDMPSATSVQHWLKDNRCGFKARYWEAREVGYQAIADQMLKIVDDRRNDWIVRRREDGSFESILDPERVNRAELRIKTRCWLLSKMLPKQFGDRLDITARQHGSGSKGGDQSDMAEFMKLLNGRSRGLPSEDEPLDEA
jgi:hypothetical protein